VNQSTSAVVQPQQGILVITGAPQSQELPVSQMLAVLRQRWLLIALVSLVAVAGTLTYSLLAAKWYRAPLVMGVVPPDNGTGNLGSAAGGLGGIAALAGFDLAGNDNTKKEYVARIMSRAFIYRFMTDEGIIPILFAKQWDSASQRWKSADDQPSLEKAFKEFNGRVLTISDDKRSGLIKVSVDWKDPELAMKWANKLVAQFNADARETARTEAHASLEYLQRELAHTDVVDLRLAINNLIERETRKAMIASVREQYAFKIIDPAFLPGKEGIVWPRPALFSALALMAGAVIGGILALVLGPKK
jgi:uncharacterized protein involved in exopolysaccharide biosynthesis